MSGRSKSAFVPNNFSKSFDGRRGGRDSFLGASPHDQYDRSRDFGGTMGRRAKSFLGDGGPRDRDQGMTHTHTHTHLSIFFF